MIRAAGVAFIHTDLRPPDPPSVQRTNLPRRSRAQGVGPCTSATTESPLDCVSHLCLPGAWQAWHLAGARELFLDEGTNERWNTSRDKEFFAIFINLMPFKQLELLKMTYARLTRITLEHTPIDEAPSMAHDVPIQSFLESTGQTFVHLMVLPHTTSRANPLQPLSQLT